MSRKPGKVLPAVEWSPSYVRTALPSQPSVDGIPAGCSAVRACLSRRNTFVRALRIPNVSGGEADRILRMQVPQTFPIPPGELVFAYRLTQDVGPEGKLAVVSATQAQTVRDLEESLRSMGAKAEDVVAAAFGSALLAKSLGLANTAVVERTLEGWAIDLVIDSELRYSRVVPLETEPSALESEVCRTFGMAGLPCGSILATGGARLDFADVRSEHSTLEMLAGAEAGSLGVTLELPDVVHSREKKAVGNRARLAVLLWVATIVLGLFVGVDRMEKAEEVRRFEARNDLGSKRLKSIRDGAQLKESGITKTAEMLVRAFEPAQKSSEVLSIASSLAPQGVWLTGMTFERGKPMSLRGTATSSNAVAAYQDALSNHERFREVQLVFSNEAVIEDTKVSQFSISLRAIGNIPVVEPKQRGRAATK